MLKGLLISVIKFYQRLGSPTKLPRCRFYPSCSNYGIEALERHGVLKGGALLLFRLLRCHPLCRGGYDPVPELRQKRKNKSKNQHGGRFS